MTIKDFRVGEKVYKVQFENKNNDDVLSVKNIKEGKVIKIGKKYLSALFLYSSEFNDSKFEDKFFGTPCNGEFCLICNSPYYNESSKLFKNEEDIKKYIYKRTLDKKIYIKSLLYQPESDTLENVQTIYNLLIGKFQANKQYMAECALPGCTMTNSYIVLTCNIEEVQQKLNIQFPGVRIKNIFEINTDCIFEKGRTAYSPLLDTYSPCNIQKVWPK